jgi:putative NADH-flavin reductase
MRVLVTGATGVVGRRLCAALVARGDQVLAHTRRPRRAEPGIFWLEGDAADSGTFLHAMGTADAVVNLAGALDAARAQHGLQGQSLLAGVVREALAVLLDLEVGGRGHECPAQRLEQLGELGHLVGVARGQRDAAAAGDHGVAAGPGSVPRAACRRAITPSSAL